LTEFGPRDYLQRGESVFSYSHALLSPQKVDQRTEDHSVTCQATFL
jgi:hypothetical protein